ncbi:MAG TPA: chemotaxis protein CheW [Candidatus Methanoculleus thermohydrogenotrophicum]|jgi:purine-binding chemotaxis protein CheW|nr:chemotaxis protein CheW [Candidatus Methanoculleus thermohydrogenotrophicum]NLM81417.1 purine-binding chemotaxis protein CheW [Candidatus Methanoculleus thermohydrogenotrophicum]HOB18919.1 chemotaxis protein CheW [Candidatus Methanoculleus thermohydrogenotrophicum]HPZ38971.1 chemotaxis protein CheW [Candidatus Methanoculleus thermohydrogenotrophicum]HQC92116.1 chemotaxis protein CheW [Candidatus Methanoculleus thermohydrogenotrophicum]
MIDVVEFELGRELYAMDIQLAREIVEMMPITRIPRAPDYIAGIMNLRGEITTIIDLKRLIQIPGTSGDSQKIIVLVAEAAGGSNLGIIVDDVHSVIQVSENDIELMDEGISSGVHDFVKGIIKLAKDDGERKRAGGGQQESGRLVLWIDIKKILDDLVRAGRV